MDQTNREGLIHNQALDDLRRLVYFVLQSIEAERQSIRHPLRKESKVDTVGDIQLESISSRLDKLAKKSGSEIGDELRSIKQSLEERSQKDATERKKLVDGYSGVAAIGQMAAGMAPVIPHEIKRIRDELERMKSVLTHRRIPEVRESFTGLEASLASIDEMLRVITTASGGMERRRAIDLVAEARSFRDLILPLLQAHGAEMEIIVQENDVLRTEMRPEKFCCLLQILTTNSLEWTKSESAPRLKLTLRGVEDRCELLFTDNGPGIPCELAEKAFMPLFTRKEGGRGMGLTIARQVVEAHNGSIVASTDGRRRGANLQITLSRKRPKATGYY